MRPLTIVLCLLAASCSRGEPDHEPLTGGNPAKGRELIARYGCGSCHAIPGIPSAQGQVGPPLAGIRERVYLGGVLYNSPEAIQKWILNPREFAPGTAMPAVGANADEARDIAAYLYRAR